MNYKTRGGMKRDIELLLVKIHSSFWARLWCQRCL